MLEASVILLAMPLWILVGMWGLILTSHVIKFLWKRRFMVLWLSVCSLALCLAMSYR